MCDCVSVSVCVICAFYLCEGLKFHMQCIPGIHIYVYNHIQALTTKLCMSAISGDCITLVCIWGGGEGCLSVAVHMAVQCVHVSMVAV